MEDKIRPYGPGKFNTILDSYVYQVSLDGGCDDEIGSVDEGGWFGMMRNGRTIFRDHDPLLETLNEAEQELLTTSAGVIIEEDSQGFVYVTYYTADAELDVAWDALQPDKTDYSCNQCQALMINGVYCHETGCPNTHKFKVDGEWVTPETDESGGE